MVTDLEAKVEAVRRALLAVEPGLRWSASIEPPDMNVPCATGTVTAPDHGTVVVLPCDARTPDGAAVLRALIGSCAAPFEPLGAADGVTIASWFVADERRRYVDAITSSLDLAPLGPAASWLPPPGPHRFDPPSIERLVEALCGAAPRSWLLTWGVADMPAMGAELGRAGRAREVVVVACDVRTPAGEPISLRFASGKHAHLLLLGVRAELSVFHDERAQLPPEQLALIRDRLALEPLEPRWPWCSPEAGLTPPG